MSNITSAAIDMLFKGLFVSIKMIKHNELKSYVQALKNASSYIHYANKTQSYYLQQGPNTNSQFNEWIKPIENVYEHDLNKLYNIMTSTISSKILGSYQIPPSQTRKQSYDAGNYGITTYDHSSAGFDPIPQADIDGNMQINTTYNIISQAIPTKLV